MRSRWLAVAATLALTTLASPEARAQQRGYFSRLNTYTINVGAANLGAAPGALSGPNFAAGSLPGGANGSFMVGSMMGGYSMPSAYSGAGGYAMPSGYAGYPPNAAWQGYQSGVPTGAMFYPGYRGYRGYAYLSYGRGRTFGAYPPRFYPTYQPRPFGRFDR
jgi:hypothetical protein